MKKIIDIRKFIYMELLLVLILVLTLKSIPLVSASGADTDLADASLLAMRQKGRSATV